MEFFYCPYCGGQALFPIDEHCWECRSCIRIFAVTLQAVGYPTHDS
ncbi:hypothetical protein MULP_01004 [Mycobacterium liflandii 128FXT]|uniref:Insertion element protein n=1 Tax=Mycobacterium liflandii (strain 128FXT) TaxID=459424 RepID=L7UZX3_MYCL1|nr:hypothetical protein MULP_01004 [Mycobacterium liflandii 128FXT]RFZ49650.1 hypothetical protein BB170200_05386 [Mycobacterium marinum]